MSDYDYYFYKEAHRLWGLDLLLNPLIETLRDCKTLEPNYRALEFTIRYDDEMTCEPHERPTKKVIYFNIVAPYQASYTFNAEEKGEYPSVTKEWGSDLYVAILPTEEQKNQLRDDYIRYFLCNS